jgi:hypothetical protein
MPDVTNPLDRDLLGRRVREAWVRWAKDQHAPKSTWLGSYDMLSEEDKEADRQIGESIAAYVQGVLGNPSPDTAPLWAVREISELSRRLGEVTGAAAMMRLVLTDWWDWWSTMATFETVGTRERAAEQTRAVLSGDAGASLLPLARAAVAYWGAEAAAIAAHAAGDYAGAEPHFQRMYAAGPAGREAVAALPEPLRTALEARDA